MSSSFCFLAFAQLLSDGSCNVRRLTTLRLTPHLRIPTINPSPYRLDRLAHLLVLEEDQIPNKHSNSCEHNSQKTRSQTQYLFSDMVCLASVLGKRVRVCVVGCRQSRQALAFLNTRRDVGLMLAGGQDSMTTTQKPAQTTSLHDIIFSPHCLTPTITLLVWSWSVKNEGKTRASRRLLNGARRERKRRARPMPFVASIKLTSPTIHITTTITISFDAFDDLMRTTRQGLAQGEGRRASNHSPPLSEASGHPPKSLEMLGFEGKQSVGAACTRVVVTFSPWPCTRCLDRGACSLFWSPGVFLMILSLVAP